MILFVLGAVLLTWCNRFERKLDEKIRDPREKWAIIDGGKTETLRKRKLGGTILVILGGGCSLYGMFLFFTNI